MKSYVCVILLTLTTQLLLRFYVDAHSMPALNGTRIDVVTDKEADPNATYVKRHHGLIATTTTTVEQTDVHLAPSDEEDDNSSATIPPHNESNINDLCNSTKCDQNTSSSSSGSSRELTLGLNPSNYRKSYVTTADPCSTFRFAIYAVLYGCLTVGGIAANILCVVVLWNERHKSATMLLLLLLAVIDALVLLVWSVMLTLPSLATYTNTLPVFIAFYPYLQMYGWALCNVVQTISCWLIVLITLQRYIAVRMPYDMRTYSSVAAAWLQFLAVVICSILFNLPRFFEYDVIRKESGQLQRISTPFGRKTSYQMAYKSIVHYLFMYVIPLGLICYCTVALIVQLQRSRKKVRPSKSIVHNNVLTASGLTTTTHLIPTRRQSQIPSTSQLTVPQNETKHGSLKSALKKTTSPIGGNTEVTFALVVVDIVFFLCQLLNPLRRILDYTLRDEHKVCGTIYSYFAPFSGFGIFLNSSVNFFIFCLCGRGFRRLVYTRLCCKQENASTSANGVTERGLRTGDVRCMFGENEQGGSGGRSSRRQPPIALSSKNIPSGPHILQVATTTGISTISGSDR